MDTPAPFTTQARVRALAPDPPATVRVQNLAATVQHSGHDAWNRANKQQPCLMSAEVAFAAPFDSASAADKLGGDTVHYGTLAKQMLQTLADNDAEDYGKGQTLGQLLLIMHCQLTGTYPAGWSVVPGGSMRDSTLLLDMTKVRLVSVTLALPKASLLGDGVKMTATSVFRFDGDNVNVEAQAVALEVTRLRVPTLIGVNANERTAKQFVVVTVTVEMYRAFRDDIYTDIETAVVKAMEESSFETLEALGAHLANVVMSSKWREKDWQVCIRMEKPTAIAMADCPIVEVRQG